MPLNPKYQVIIDDHEREDILPAITDRQQRMLNILDDGTIMDLALEIGEMAVEDQEHLRWPVYYHDHDQIDPSLSTASSVAIADADGPREMCELLHTIHPKVVHSIILNTIAYQWTADDHFKDLVMPVDGCAGSYVATFAVKGRNGKGLTIKEWRMVQQKWDMYIAKDPKDAVEATIIDMKYPCASWNKETILEGNENGERKLWFKTAHQFSECINLRIPSDWVPNEDVPQLQSPLYIGCSKDLAARVHYYDPLGTMSAASKSWRLLMSILKHCGIEVDTIMIPLIKIWETSHLNKAEILLTMLAGSHISEGGLNQHPPGGHRSMNHSEDKFLEAQTQAFCRYRWTTENLRRSEEELDRRLRAFDTLRSLESLAKERDEMNEGIELLDRKLDSIAENVKVMERSMEDRTNLLLDEAKRLDEATKLLEPTIEALKMQLQFHKNVEKWVESRSP
ncbi:hypothetical protein VTL71DRAFT_12252 [Oculimacula yallundae]|uniref:Uncharacterized protein n=1 Tax=Oculimacula yallundae TaxID=86028 RepID=A0ABR4CSE6_9HELO